MQPNPPLWLKKLLLPLYNGCVHSLRELVVYAQAIWSRRFERCTCCGKDALMLYRRRVIPNRLSELWELSPRITEALCRKESSNCSRCGAKLRARRLAQVLIDLYPVSPPAQSLAEWVKHPNVANLKIAEVNKVDGLHDTLAKLPTLAYSDFHEGAATGSYVNQVRNEDLSALSYANNSFDLVITSETLEHIPNLQAALTEIHRVLVPGGRHVFTVPLLPGVPTTYARSVIDPTGRIHHLAPPICHPGGDIGYPVFTEFGADFSQILQAAGFAVTVHFGPVCDDDLAQVYVATKLTP
jgi:SAM-dependent methyltransferase